MLHPNQEEILTPFFKDVVGFFCVSILAKNKFGYKKKYLKKKTWPSFLAFERMMIGDRKEILSLYLTVFWFYVVVIWFVYSTDWNKPQSGYTCQLFNYEIENVFSETQMQATLVFKQCAKKQFITISQNITSIPQLLQLNYTFSINCLNKNVSSCTAELKHDSKLGAGLCIILKLGTFLVFPPLLMYLFVL